MTELSLQGVSDKKDYEFIKDQSLAWIVAIENEIKAGKTPETIRDEWADEYKRDKMALRIFHAARHIFNERVGN
ncbi:MAG: hypothetical protein ACYTFW_25950 [Planctomycetota bacterium]|jgi:hypothetical protein